MKTLGIIGGMSWESTAGYYNLINRGVRDHLGGLHSAPLLISSYDFAGIENLQAEGKWGELGTVLAGTAGRLVEAGAEGIMIATNTMHEVADFVADSVSVPLLHIADALGEVLVEDGISIVGLLGTRFTMERLFYVDRLKSRFGVDAMIPDESDRKYVHSVIYNELCRGIVSDASKDAYMGIMQTLRGKGAHAIALACTEIGLLVKRTEMELPIYDTTEIHAEAAVRWILGER